MMTKIEERNIVIVYDSMLRRPIYPSDGENIDRVENNSRRWKSTKLEGRNPKDLAELIFRMIDGERTFIVGNIKPQCGTKRFRTIEDMFRIAKYYKPNVKLSDIHKAVKSLYNNCITYNYCCTVHRFVHKKASLTKTVNDYRSFMGQNNIKFGNVKKSS